MSYSQAQQQQPVVTKNTYFTYAEGVRSPEQIWNVDGLTICLQGTLPACGTDKTYLARKHMLTFAGGKMASYPNSTTEQGIWAKVNNTRNKRMHQNIRPTGVKPGATAKYGSTKIGANDPNPPCTFIYCDAVDPMRLREIFAERLKQAVKQHETYAEIWFKGLKCVVTVTNNNWVWTDNCRVTFKASDDLKSFMLIHLEGIS